MNVGLDSKIQNEVLDFCRHVAGASPVTAVGIINSYPSEKAKDKAVFELLAVIHNFQPRLLSYVKVVGDKTFLVFAVDQWIFERDIDRGFLGEAIAGKLVFPHHALFGEGYLYQSEVALKKRLILESLENLVYSFPELANTMQIKPQYFPYEVLLNRIRVFPLLAYDMPDLMACLQQDEAQALEGYSEALKQLAAEEKILLSQAYLTIPKKFITKCQDPKTKIINLSKNLPRRLFTSYFGVLPQFMNIVSQNTEAFLKTQKINWHQPIVLPGAVIDPQKYVYFPTSEGLVSLADKVDVKSFAQKMLSAGKSQDIEVEPFGGVLNDVYLIRAHSGGVETKVLAKRFKDWSGFKWFPLTVWSFGARSFAVSAQARLAKECATSEFLRNEGFKVPKILHVSNAERLVFMEFIEGENLGLAIKRIAAALAGEDTAADLAKVVEAGELLAKVHSHNMTLGDTKPENMLVKPDGTIYLIDFEQATRDGDKAWDVAVFLYFSGHYIQPFESTIKAEIISKAFIEGYLCGGGNVADVQKAGLPKYTRVFSVFTLPATIRAISNVCKKT
jgi:tRNA A-37 threonylcarbamoyl transferase component Bud32